MKRHQSKNLAHHSDGKRHIAAAALHVLVMPSADGGYFAQGLQIDYVATGATEDEARKRFETGFVETVKAYLKRGLDLGALYDRSRTPKECWQAYYKAAQQPVFGCVVKIDLGEDAADLPRSINFIPAPAKACEA